MMVLFSSKYLLLTFPKDTGSNCVKRWSKNNHRDVKRWDLFLNVILFASPLDLVTVIGYLDVQENKSNSVGRLKNIKHGIPAIVFQAHYVYFGISIGG